MNVYEELILLRKKISPLENKKFTETIKQQMLKTDLELEQRSFRGEKHYVVRLPDLWGQLFEDQPTPRDLTELARSLQALLWERSALNGRLIFVKPKQEYEEHGY